MVGGSTKRVKLGSPDKARESRRKLLKRSRIKKEASLCSSDKLVDLTGD